MRPIFINISYFLRTKFTFFYLPYKFFWGGVYNFGPFFCSRVYSQTSVFKRFRIRTIRFSNENCWLEMSLFSNKVLVLERRRPVAALTKRKRTMEPRLSNASFFKQIGCRTKF